MPTRSSNTARHGEASCPHRLRAPGRRRRGRSGWSVPPDPRTVGAGVRGTLSVETSYREDVQLEALPGEIGNPYFDPFVVSTMRPVEMAAEKLRTLAQRARGTDLADCVLLERIAADELDQLPALRAEKFRLLNVSTGLETVLDRIEELRGQYERDVRALDPNAPSHAEARDAAQRFARRAWR